MLSLVKEQDVVTQDNLLQLQNQINYLFGDKMKRKDRRELDRLINTKDYTELSWEEKEAKDAEKREELKRRKIRRDREWGSSTT